jgi:hypothetical protein
MGEGTDVLLKEFVPQDLRDKGYLKDLLDKPWGKESAAEVFKKLDNAESLIGKRPLIPAKDASEADWDKFLAGLRPDKAEDYDIPLPEGVKLDERGQAYTKALKEAMLEAGIPKPAAKKFIAKMQAFGTQDQKELAAKLDAEKKRATLEFDTAAKAALGDKREEIITRVRGAIEELAPAAFKSRIAKLANEDLLTMAGTINAIMEKYIPADKLNAKAGAGSGSTGQDEEAVLDTEAKTIQASPIYRDQFHVEHQKMRDRLKAIFGRIVEIREEKKKKK